MKYKIIIQTVILRVLSFNYDKLPILIQTSLPFMKGIQPYFKKHPLGYICSKVQYLTGKSEVQYALTEQ